SSRTRILIADSYRDAADSLGVLLMMSGYECAIAYSGPQALELERTFRPDVAFVELSLEGISGLDVARQVRKVGVVPIALTGFADKAHRQLASEAGFMAYLVKPVTLARLQETLNRF